MAVLSHVEDGDLDYPRSLVERLLDFPFLADATFAAVEWLLANANWFSLPGGALLDRSGENCRALFLVLTGHLSVFIEDETGKRRVIGEISQRETIGEMSIISGEPPMASVVALRDSELLRIGADAFHELVAICPKIMSNVAHGLSRRLSTSAHWSGHRELPKTIALVPAHDSLEIGVVTLQLVTALRDLGYKTALLQSSDGAFSTDALNNLESSYDFVVYRGDKLEDPWTNLCLRQADKVLMLASVGLPFSADRFTSLGRDGLNSARPDLLLLQPAGGSTGGDQGRVIPRDRFQSCFHLRAGNKNDVPRLARFISGRAVALALAGGGARGFAHIGVAKALAEAGVPFDRLGGTSMGAIIAAGLAADWSIDELIARMREAFVKSNPLSDYTLPLVALVRGHKVSALLRQHFGSICIEDLPKPFLCVSANLTLGRLHIHEQGPLWRALRASVSLPGILPPVSENNHLLVDGGVMNNLPVDLMARLGRGPILASDVTGEVDLRASDDCYGERSVWRLIWQRMRGTPSIVSILMRSATVGSEAQRRVVREQASHLFEPHLDNIGLRDWGMFDQAIAAGYVHAARMIDKQVITLTAVA